MSKHLLWLSVLVALLALGGPAQAGLKMYQGSLVFHGYGNTRDDGFTLMGMATGAITWNTNTFLAEPQGAYCNYKNYTVMANICNGAPPPTGYSRCFISTFYTPPRETKITGPCPTYPPPSAPITGSGTALTRTSSFVTAMGATACAGGCAKNAAAIIMPGATPTTTPYGVYTFIGGLGGMGSGSVDYNLDIGENIIYSVTHLTLGTGPGTFFPGGGPTPNIASATGMQHPILGTPGGPSIFSFKAGPGAASGYIAIRPGANRFGGAMRLLGKNGGGNQLWWSPNVGGYIATSLKFMFNVHGTYQRGQQCPYPGPYPSLMYNPCPSRTTNFLIRTDGDMNSLLTTGGSPVTTVSRFIKTATRWSTGAAAITAPGFGFTTVIQRTGYDNRNSNGTGTIQLVAPHLTNWFFGVQASSLGGISIMNLRFVPEPSSWLLLGVGTAVVLVLSRRGRTRS
jgi:hypothetical protein